MPEGAIPRPPEQASRAGKKRNRVMKKYALLLAGFALACFSTLAFAGGFLTNGLPAATTPLSGVETLPMDTNLSGGRSPQSTAVTTAQLVAGAAANASRSANAATASTTATAAQVTGSGGFVVLDMTGTLAAAGNLTTPTAAQIIAAAPNVMLNDSYVLRIINETAATNAWTLVGGSNVTVSGTATISAATYTDFLVTLAQGASPATVTFQRIGSGPK